jgi:pteridine reductase
MQDTIPTSPLSPKVTLVTGGARRIGAAIVRTLHGAGMNIALQYRNSREDAEQLQKELNTVRSDSVHLFQADLLHTRRIPTLISEIVSTCNRLDVVVNNASSFYPTPLGSVTEEAWADLMGTNLMAPFFIAQAAAPHLRAGGGCIVNLTDIYGRRPLKNHPVYCAAKAGLIMLTQSLARELGPEVRVNAVAPGAILWPEGEDLDEVAKQRILSRIVLRRIGDPEDIARAVLFLVRDATYCTGEMIVVDGGSLSGR